MCSSDLGRCRRSHSPEGLRRPFDPSGIPLTGSIRPDRPRLVRPSGRSHRRESAVPRIAEGRPAAKPSSSVQKDRYQRILRAAAKLGAEHGLEHVQMNDVAKQANVAIATLYRYFPSKVDLFSSVMRWRVGEYDQPEVVAVSMVPSSRTLIVDAASRSASV